MRIGKSLRNRLGLHLRALPVTKNLQFVVLVFICVFFAGLTLVYLSSSFTSAARAYVQGEGTWSKNQKQATIRLQEYSASHDEKDYQAFLDSLSVQLGDRIAREQLEKPDPDYAAIHAGFRQGKVAEVDIPGMITLFRRFRKTKEIDTAVGLWTTADGYIEELRAQGAQLHAMISTKSASDQEIAALTRKIESTDGKLTPLENEFSEELSAGARRIERLLSIGLPLAGCFLLGLGVTVSSVIVQQVPELASLLRVRYPQMKVIYMSGYTESALVQDGMLERNTVLLQKPFPIGKIPEIIRQMNTSVHG